MDIIQMAREMGKEIQKSEIYANLNAAKKNNDEDEELQDLIGQFNLKRITINNQINDNQKHDEDEMRRLDSELKEIYNKIITNKNMAAYNDAKNAMDDLMNQVSTILMHCVNGADPETCPSKQESGCSGSCSSCSGCH
ncbi:MAG: YlbF family regulator [Clostridiales bacterium]|nr:YlbF family regulator [Clostridiales bacterium]